MAWFIFSEKQKSRCCIAFEYEIQVNIVFERDGLYVEKF